MIESEEQLRKMVEQVEQKERHRRRKALLYTLIPVLVAVGMLAMAASQVQKSSQAGIIPQTELAYNQKTLAVAETSLARPSSTSAGAIIPQTTLVAMQAKVNQLQMTVTSQSSQLDFSQMAWQDSYYQGDLQTVGQYIQSLENLKKIRPGPAKLLDQILANLKVPWKADGKFFLEGVNSPTYVSQILNPKQFRSIDQATLMKELPFKKDRPEIGDVVYYADGYSFFYFVDEKGQDLVIGMTPFGVVALKYDFARPVGFGDSFQ